MMSSAAMPEETVIAWAADDILAIWCSAGVGGEHAMTALTER